MPDNKIKRVDYKNAKKNLDFEIVDIQLFFSTRPHKALQKDYRVNFWSIIYITEGSGKHFIDFKSYDYNKGDIIFILKNQVHHYKINDDVKGYVIHINEPFFYKVEGFDGDIFLEYVDRAFGSPVVHFDNSNGRSNRVLMDLIYHEYNKRNDNLNIELMATLFQGFILSLRGQLLENSNLNNSKDYEHFKRFRKFVENNYRKTRNVEDYSEMMHVSKKTINQGTRNVAGLSAKQFIIERVILEIKRYLSQGELMNYEIADVLGFYEAANMTKFFKQYQGESPKEFKENLKR